MQIFLGELDPEEIVIKGIDVHKSLSPTTISSDAILLPGDRYLHERNSNGNKGSIMATPDTSEVIGGGSTLGTADIDEAQQIPNKQSNVKFLKVISPKKSRKAEHQKELENIKSIQKQLENEHRSSK